MEIKVVKQIMEWNEDCSNEVKKELDEKKVFMINIMGSPGAGKTSVIVELIKELSKDYKLAVIEGDITGQIDAERISQMGIPVVQLNTDGACHIEAMSIKNILNYFNLNDIDVLLIENIGNLVCPAEFNLGEDLKVAILSIPEGDDKVQKYPLMFSVANILLLNKYDMKEFFEFDYEKVSMYAKGLNPNLEIYRFSSKKEFDNKDLFASLRRKIKDKLNK
ncbi:MULTISPECIES: hydrogenase nickel incorporation protein HypB [Caloramator]|uniref:[NiFe] hydrogenase nickel incorporation-associated protein HypB n=1 Tax=Caloramator australicus RC3 TaxID=857293 RepID=I7LIZ4_9CLOT|nr:MULTISPECIES: hydrogenase nickel incorporation protein HypB [Caloramator]MDO6354431.1 hydrogenase nickel incorporation protein HypB [Caloramator sp. CAR-1]CCJ33337.1 [NiFe] hydrogenase nickel incorporation-associated protein HypB [Caloramator australicus RC3]